MAYSKKTWTNRTSEYPNRYQMTSMNGNIADVAIIPKEGTITNEGDRFDAATMNDMETRIDNEFSSVESSMSAQDTTLRGLITAEQTRATGIENLLRTDVDTNTSGLASEISRATAKENDIADDLADEITRATGIEGGLRTDVTSLQGRMTDTESDVDTLTSRIATLEQSVEIETDRAEDAEATLDTKIDGVASDLDAEITRATNAENILTTNLTNEISRAQSVENSLTTSITNEIARATQAESNLHDYVDEKVSTAYKASGSVYFEDLPALAKNRVGHVYNIKDDFTTTADFLEGEGKSYKAGTNVAIVGVEEDGTIVYKYDVQAGFVDYSLFATQEEVDDISNVYGAKNLLSYPYYDGDSKTTSGVTFSVDNNGIVHANGTSTTYCSYNFANDQLPLKLNAGKYILSSGASLPLYIYLGVWYTTISPYSNTNLVALRLNNVEKEFEITEEMATKIENGEAYLLVRLASDSNQSGVAWDSMTLYPMIRLKSIKNATWRPYAKTNRELTQQQYTFVGVCESAGNVQNKIVTVDGGFKLEKGVRIAVKFSNTNTFVESSSARITFNVNDTGAKQVNYGSGGAITWADGTAFGAANQYGFYVYDGTSWVWDGHNKDNNVSSVMTVSELKAGTSTSSRVVRPDYLHQGITEMIDEHGSSGHTIVDSNGAELTSRSKLKFLNATVTDDETNDQTIVTPEGGGEIPQFTLAEWDALTDAEKAQYDGKEFVITDDYDGEPIDSELSLESENPIQNKVVTKGINDVKDGISDIVNVLGAKNLLKITAASFTTAGVTFTVNTDSDGNKVSVTVDGTATTDAYFVLGSRDFGTERFATDGTSDNSDYVLSGLPTSNQFYIAYAPSNSNIIIRVLKDYTVDNVTIYPMIRLKSIEDDTYVPYAMTNRELTENAETEVIPLTANTSAGVNYLSSDAACRRCGKVMVISGFIRFSTVQSAWATVAQEVLPKSSGLGTFAITGAIFKENDNGTSKDIAVRYRDGYLQMYGGTANQMYGFSVVVILV